MQGPDFDLDFKPAHGAAVTVADDVQRITVNNPGPSPFRAPTAISSASAPLPSSTRPG